MSFQEGIDSKAKRRQGDGETLSPPSCNTHARDPIEEARAFWQPYAAHELTREDAREIIANVSGFFRVLRAWSEEDRRAARTPK